MEVKVLKWFHYSQNNSGGYFIENDDVGRDVFIQDISFTGAKEKSRYILSSYREFCECCGERWDEEWGDDLHGSIEPTIYGMPLKEEYDAFLGEYAVLYHYDGRKTYVPKHCGNYVELDFPPTKEK